MSNTMNKAITILSYCDTEEKKEALRSIIAKAKELYPDRILLVYSHYSGVECEYYSQADYYIYDCTNPPSTRTLYAWNYIPQIGKKFYRAGEDFGMAVIQMIKRSCLFLDSIGVESSLFLNYDIDIDSKSSIKMLDVSDYIKDYLGLFTEWGESQNFSLCYFWLNIKEIGRDFFNSITREKYISYDPSFIAERVFREIMMEGLGGKCLLLSDNLPGKISGASRKMKGVELCQYFETILPSKDRITGEKHIAIWDSIVPIESISIQIGSSEYDIANESSDKMFMFSPIPEQDANEIKVIKVNSNRLASAHHIKGLDGQYWEKNFHD